MASANDYGKKVPYTPPTWAQGLAVIPKSRVKLSMTPTPIHPWRLAGVPEGFEVSVKREDLAGSTLTGNKVRKLEFLLADALDQGCDGVVTVGGTGSNHIRATSLAARELGLQPHAMIFSPTAEPELPCRGNILLTRLTGARMILCPMKPECTLTEHVIVMQEKMKEYAAKLESEGHKTYVIPPGGSSTLGAWAYIDGFDEMMKQGLLERFDDIVVVAGSVGTVCGLAVAKHLTGASIKIHAVSVHNSEDFIYEFVDHELQSLGLKNVSARDLVHPIVDYIGLGYGKNTEEELETIVDVVSETGVSLDPDFCAKGVRGMLCEMRDNPGRFAGNRILFLHSGGVYALFDGKINEVMERKPICNQVSMGT